MSNAAVAALPRAHGARGDAPDDQVNRPDHPLREDEPLARLWASVTGRTRCLGLRLLLLDTGW